MLLGSHDIGDTHLDVVDNVGQQEHRRAVAAQQHEVFDRRVVEGDLAADAIVHDRRTFRDTEAEHTARARAESAIARVAVVAGQSEFLGAGLDLVGGQIAVVGEALVEQPVRRRDMRRGVGALEVRAFEMWIVGRDADPRQRVDDPLRPLRSVAGLVGVFDAQDEGATDLAGECPVVQRRARSTDVERTGR